MHPVSLGPPEPVDAIRKVIDAQRALIDAHTAVTASTPDAVALMREGDSEAAEHVKREAIRYGARHIALYLEAKACISGLSRQSHYTSELAEVLALREECGGVAEMDPCARGIGEVVALLLESQERTRERHRFHLFVIVLAIVMTFTFSTIFELLS